jgi:hypothetical protein
MVEHDKDLGLITIRLPLVVLERATAALKILSMTHHSLARATRDPVQAEIEYDYGDLYDADAEKLRAAIRKQTAR